MVALNQLGIAVSCDEIRAVGLCDGAVVWAGASSYAAVDEIASTVEELVAQAPRSGWRRPRTVAAVGVSRCQMRRLSGLPPVRDASMVAALLRESTYRFFLRHKAPLITGSAAAGADGAWWGMAVEAPVLLGLEDVCRRMRLRLVALVPAIAVIGRVAEAPEIHWSDGEVAVLGSYDRGRLVELRRVEVADRAASLPAPPSLTALGGDSGRYLDAYAAAGLDRLEEIPSVRPSGSAPSDAVPRWRSRVAAAVFGLSAAAAIALPGVAPRYMRARAEARLAALAGQGEQALAREAELRRFEGALAEFGSLTGRIRQPAVQLLAGLTRVLPDSAALTGLRLDSTGGELVVLAPRAALVPALLERLPLIASPGIAGPVTREILLGRDVERATVRFQLP